MAISSYEISMARWVSENDNSSHKIADVATDVVTGYKYHCVYNKSSDDKCAIWSKITYT